ncbi:transcription factor WhiB [Streptomyces sp. S1D4-20]|uniref:transcription factor WhiB n=1 Tax=Streptomyces sp. S1D4-20 TaxID=2594462 RepID=UPI0011642314|nr:transcription factor WhiB [Streptomyces sp. S1D4-20]QDN57352.1 transcription factor WhiB [Streptomyces sp. S1D4-20]
MTDQPVLITGIRAGLHIRGIDRGDTPIADYLCGRCGHHHRATGRDEVTTFLRTDPVASHHAECLAASTAA